MSNHTPGPWRLNQGALLTVEADGHLGPIAELRSRLDYAGMNPIVAQTRDANARLIAAAPELLEALQAIVKTCNVRIDDPRIQHFDKARAAIAKATGEQL